jgi:hypothetical protein
VQNLQQKKFHSKEVGGVTTVTLPFLLDSFTVASHNNNINNADDSGVTRNNNIKLLAALLELVLSVAVTWLVALAVVELMT